MPPPQTTAPNHDYVALRELRGHLHTKLMRDVPEYRQLVALDEVIATGEAPGIPGLSAIEPPAPRQTIEGLALAAVRKAGVPLHIDVLLDEIDRVKKFPDRARARINVVSALSKGKAMRSVKWRGEYAWWPQGERLPEETKGSAL